MRGLDGKLAFVTCAGRGIGEAIAKRRAAEGAKVAVADIIEDNARQTADAIGAAAISLAVGITNSAAVRTAVAECKQWTGAVHISVDVVTGHPARERFRKTDYSALGRRVRRFAAGTDDRREGMGAFLEKRAPSFRGR